MTLGDRIKLIRGSVAREKFAPEMDVSKNTLIAYETDARCPGADFLNKILELYPEISPAWLLSGEGDMKRNVRLVPTGEIDADNLTPESYLLNKNGITQVGGDKVPKPQLEHLDRKLLELTIARLQPVFRDHDITDPADQAGLICDVYGHIKEKNLKPDEENVGKVVSTAEGLFKNLDLLKSFVDIGGFISRLPKIFSGKK